jgi:hypothetical protein
VVGDHAYWISGLTLRSHSQLGNFDARSHGFGTGDPAPSPVKTGVGTLRGGYLGPITYVSFAKTWGPTPIVPRSDVIDVTASNIATAAINVRRAHVDCNVVLHVSTDGPITIRLPGCHRTVIA